VGYTNAFATIPAIETRYGSRHFRSRIEARWAVYFDVAGIAWDYEPENFLMENGEVYIPDFWLPDLGRQDDVTFERGGLFVEIKGKEPTELERCRAYWLSKQTGKSVLVFWGSNFDTGHDLRLWRELEQLKDWKPLIAQFRQCPHCGVLEAGPFDGHFCLERAAVAERYGVLHYFDQDLEYPAESPMLALARESAQSARFESPEWTEEIKGLILAGRRLRDQKIYCVSEVTAQIISRASEWAEEQGGRSCPELEPWWPEHAKSLRLKTQCSCGHCEGAREQAEESHAVNASNS
jgi:hypothetical protein